jgi:lysophospholipase L1-like esterase
MHKIRIIHFGDSLTECINIKESEKWSYLCKEALIQKYKHSITLGVQNKGICGNNTRQALERMQEDVQFEEPDILTIQFGVNDSDYWLSNRGVPVVSELAFKANLIEMIERARIFGIDHIIFHTNHCFSKDRIEINEKTHNENIQNYNQIIRRIANEFECELVDIHKALLNRSPDMYTLPHPDGVHLNEFGCKLYYREIKPVIDKCIRRIIRN